MEWLLFYGLVMILFYSDHCRVVGKTIPSYIGRKIGSINELQRLQVQKSTLGKNPKDSSKNVLYQPRHVHISYGNGPMEMFITWSTLENPNSNGTIVEYGIDRFNETWASGVPTLFVDTGVLRKKQYIHRVHLKNLIPNQRYLYHCGSDKGWSETFSFKTMQNGTDWSPHLAVYGDLGTENAISLKRLQREVQLGLYDAVLHLGDFGYDLFSNNGLVGDEFMEQIQPIAAYLPYMTCPGNHEVYQNFSHYKNRFTMPGEFDSMLYSFNMGPIHFISFSTEFYYFLEYGMKPLVQQYEWMENDLKEAAKPENRAQRPWIVTYGHRPMYCSNSELGMMNDCSGRDTLVRVGIPQLQQPRKFGLEDLFMRYGVDLCIWAHDHSYERMFPLYNYAVYNGSLEEPYRNPRALVHITTGSAGCLEKHDPFLSYVPSWSAFRTTDYGYSRLKAINSTHLYMEQISEDKEGRVIDSVTIIRDEHKPFPFPDPTFSSSSQKCDIATTAIIVHYAAIGNWKFLQ